MGFGEIEWDGVELIHLAHDREHGNKPLGSIKGENFLTR
jgi:hypothetical protein